MLGNYKYDGRNKTVVEELEDKSWKKFSIKQEGKEWKIEENR